jgi:hypothetical protein
MTTTRVPGPTAAASAAWRGGYEQALSALDALPPTTLAPRVATVESVELLASWRDGYALGFKELKRRNKCATIEQAHRRCTLVDRGVLYRRWPAGLTVNGKRPELTPEEVRGMSQADLMAYRSGRAAEVPIKRA